MNIFGIGPMEMGVIAVIALMIFGPAKLPEVMGQAGKAVADFRRMTSGFQKEFESTMSEAKKLTGEFQKEVNSLTGAVNPSTARAATKTSSTTTSAKKPTTSTTKTSTTSKTASKVSSTASKTTSTSTAKATTATKAATPVASREDPTAGISLFEPSVANRPRRVRTAAPAAITDLLPRQTIAEVETSVEVAAEPVNEALARARKRRAGITTPAQISA